jgi:hypothetical protein
MVNGADKHDVNPQELYRSFMQMLERLVKNQDDSKVELLNRIDQSENHLSARIDRLDNKIYGNGDENAIIVRVRENSRAIASIDKRLAGTRC